ncbi:PREDICTED: uncharacterized protein LOC109158921 [Ipomoea nil]|uniref:uncharacterized protein LOC109158921 n=1 Tax=Ipomoea nil TaxID=35883 RepID=UPI0009013EB1|nr:PREDICTED: uncharacterized protein LOC109158921 [Ipomoea nil]
MSAGAEEDKMPVGGDLAAHINLKVRGQKRRREELIFRMKRSTRLKRLMKSYCDRKSMDLNSTAFLFHGRRLRWEQTPDELEMEDGDEIDAMLHQTVHKQFIVHEDRREMSARAEEDKMSVCSNQATHINLKVKGQKRRREELIFRMKRSTRLKRLMKSYCDRKSMDLNSTAFLFHGRRLRWEQTPDELEMEDGDEIDAMLHQTVHKQFRREMSAGAEEDKMSVCSNQATHINLKVKGQKRRREELIFRMRRSTRLKKLMKSYCDHKSVDLNSTAFLFHGRRLRWEQTPDELEMEDGDEIDAMLHQTVHKQFIVHKDRREMSAGAEEDKMPVCGDQAAHINLKVKGQKRRREELIFG